MSEPSREHVEAVAEALDRWVWIGFTDDAGDDDSASGVVDKDGRRELARDLLTSTDPAVLDAMQDALVRAGRLTEERRFVHAPFRQQCRFVTEWQEDQP